MTEAQKKALKTAVIATAGLGFVYIFLRNRTNLIKAFQHSLDFRNPLRYQKIEIIENFEDCHKIVNTLKQHCEEYKVLGFDCEWVTVGGTRRPTALLQLASHRGLCALIRLCNLKNIPINLRELLEDEDILKVGVVPNDDAIKLSFDYNFAVSSTLDLRFLATRANYKPEGLAKLAKTHLGIELDKNWRVRCSNWEAKILSEKQIDYAAKDALVAIEIFKKLSNEIQPRHIWKSKKLAQQEFFEICAPYIDVNFKEGLVNNNTSIVRNSIKTHGKNKFNQTIIRENRRTLSTRSKILYDNCFLEAPDGELLCTCDRRKAQWYIDQNLGSLVSDEPLRVRLNFEPAGRAVGEVGKYYTLAKDNKCVVCGREDAYNRKNVVPREYRKHFPIVMKSHTSHDVLLLCPPCHQLSNISDLKIREKLSKMCNAPLTNQIGGVKYKEDRKLKKIKSAGRALLTNSDKIPDNRKEILKKTILDYYAEDIELTEEMIENAADIVTLLPIDGYQSHGLKVVNEFQESFGGLVELEKLWREHFLNCMKPKFLPDLWSVTHNANRLEIRASEGRIQRNDMVIAGLDILANSGNETNNDIIINELYPQNHNTSMESLEMWD